MSGRSTKFLFALVAVAVTQMSLANVSTDTRDVLSRNLEPSEGQVMTAKDAALPSPVKAPEGAPNVLLIMTDDVGFGAVSTFGGPIPKPNLDDLAKQGITYNQFHTVGICSPTRASLLTGRNSHAVGAGFLADSSTTNPGYTSIIPPDAIAIPRILRDNGYNTAMFGKDHNIPPQHRSPAGPFDQWPTGRGFEYFYGFVGGDADQFNPVLYQGTDIIDAVDRSDDYILDEDLVDRAISWIHNQKAAAPDKPFFAYMAFGTAHAPHQAPESWIEKFRGKFDHGWDEERKRIFARQKSIGIIPEDAILAPRPEQIPAWDSLSETEKRVHARFMEVYAGMLAHHDAQVGRLIDELERMGIRDNTLVIYIEGDNGSAGEVGIHGSLNEIPSIMASESGQHYDLEWLASNLDVMGGPKTYQASPAGWSFAMNTPFPWIKQVASHLGATRNGMVISWPDGIDNGDGLRSQYHHVIDVMPTILEAAGIKTPDKVDGVEQKPLNGKSMLYSFNEPEAPSIRNTQYYEVLGNRAIYHDGWLANTKPRNMPWDIARTGAGSDTSTYGWELYNLQADFSQSNNVAGEYPEKLQEMKELFSVEAHENNVYPIQDSDTAHRRAAEAQQSKAPRTEYTYWGPGTRISLSEASPPIFWVPFTLEAQIDIPEEGADGVIYAAGSYFGGWSFYLDEGKPVVAAASSPQPGGLSRVTTEKKLPAGKHTLRFEVDFIDEGAKTRIMANGKSWGEGTITQRPATAAGLGETFDTGRDTGIPVSPDYEDGGVFTGAIHKVHIGINFPKHPSEGAAD